MEQVLHVTTPEAWERARAAGSVPRGAEPAAADDASFLHCCYEDQLAGVLERFYADAAGPLLVLEVDTAGLDVRVEPASDGAGDFPHLFADLPVESVVDVRVLERHDGRWARRP